MHNCDLMYFYELQKPDIKRDVMLTLLHKLLVVGHDSKLTNLLRSTHGYIYDIEIYHHLREYTKPFLYVYTMTDIKNVNRVDELITNTLQSMYKHITEEEFLNNKSYLIRLIMIQNDIPNYNQDDVSNFINYNKVYSCKDMIKIVEDITYTDILNYVEEIYTKQIPYKRYICDNEIYEI